MLATPDLLRLFSSFVMALASSRSKLRTWWIELNRTGSNLTQTRLQLGVSNPVYDFSDIETERKSNIIRFVFIRFWYLFGFGLLAKYNLISQDIQRNWGLKHLIETGLLDFRFDLSVLFIECWHVNVQRRSQEAEREVCEVWRKRRSESSSGRDNLKGERDCIMITTGY